MVILKFLTDFPDSAACESHFKIQRENEGIKCKKCLGTDHYWLPSKKQWECKSCTFRTTLRSGTIMEYSKMSFHKWYLAMVFMTFSKKGISAKELQKQLGQKRYESTWNLMHKLRIAMGKRDDLYFLKGMIELDEGYFTVQTSQRKKAQTKAGRGSVSSENVIVLAESTPLENVDTGNISRQCGYFKMKALSSHKADELTEAAEKYLDQKSIVFSDQSTSYVDLEKIVEAHYTEKSDETTTKTTLKWVHIAISNAKRMFNGVYHKMKASYLQNYLDEFCYKLNRRYFADKLFDRLTLAVAKIYW